MARKRRQRDGGGVLVLVASGAVAFALAAPILVFLAWIYFEIRCLFLRRVRSLDDFGLDTEDQKSLLSLDRELGQAARELDRIERTGRTLTRRQDGAFDGRNAKGRELNQRLEQLLPRHEELSAEVAELRGEPLARLRAWSFNRSARAAFRLSILVYLIALKLLSDAPPDWVTQLSDLIAKHTLLRIFEENPLLYGVTVAAAAAAILIVLPYGWLRRRLMERSFEGYDAFIRASGRDEHEGLGSED